MTKDTKGYCEQIPAQKVKLAGLIVLFNNPYTFYLCGLGNMYKNKPENTARWLLFVFLSILIHAALLIPINQILGLKGHANQGEQKRIALMFLAQEPKKQISPPTVKVPVKQVAESKKVVANKTQSSKKMPTTKPQPVSKPVIKKPAPAPLAMTTTKKLTQPSLDVGLGQEADKTLSEYQKRLLAHIQKHLSPPKNKTGSVRLEIRLEYSQIATKVAVLSSSNSDLNDWAIKAIYKANPFPPIPKNQKEPYFFRPTLLAK